MIEIKRLSKVFATEEVETTALNDIDLKVNEGDFIAVMGPSGCGKSTLLSILGMLDSPTSGEFYFLDEEVSNYAERTLTKLRKSNIGFIFQNFNLIDELTVRQNVELPLQYQHLPKAQIRKRVDSILQRVGIDHRANHFPQELSGGQQQRVAIARALVIDPKLILADEPTGNLDSKNGDQVMQLLEELNSAGTTVVMVTHSEKDGFHADRVVYMLDGKIIESDMLRSTNLTS
ncbi:MULTISPECIES: ABC transporter ATP-binding protein [Idiomarina]|uniref:ABC transporter ATP-binding protein n=1 Tax=Idiomarina TaxID=135575 RepID=UPI00031A086B|nr:MULTISPECIES: ABC transporter ATP-binding protein [unclassified Idiomarina]NWO03280.1 ABC transporter ATP-binding protein [Idiomarinaceae bacterium]|tara:strand:- start:3915 stop:4610 length:696 start_codon:yes stop_codon:yes gene_type:complete